MLASHRARRQEVYTGSFDDVQQAVEATTGLIGQGAQLVFTSGDGISQGVASAAGHQPKALTIGVTGDAGGLAKQVNVASVEPDRCPTYKSYVDRVVGGTVGDLGYTADLTNKGLVLTPPADGVPDPRGPGRPAGPGGPARRRRRVGCPQAAVVPAVSR